MFVLRAHVNRDAQTIEVTTDRWQPGIGWHEHKDFLYTESKGDWTDLEFMRWEEVHYIYFLKTMVQNNLDISRQIALLTTNLVMEYPKYPVSNLVNLLNQLPILDPTFVPPDFNLRCGWQRELLKTMCREWIPCVIATCRNHSRLSTFSRRVSLIE